MQVRASSPGRAHLIEWRARRIEDPIERLRYLRHDAGTASLGTLGVVIAPVTRLGFRENLGRRLHRLHRTLRGAAPCVLYFLALVPTPTPSSALDTLRAEQGLQSPSGDQAHEVFPAVWQVENTDRYEIYSNGLRIEDEYATSNRPRALYAVFGRMPGESPAFSWRSGVAGIVYHTTESHMLPFQADENRDLQRLGKNLLTIVRDKRSYHFVVDRFGRVFRVVKESDAANHAGESVWADATGTYVDLNDSFLGIAVETETERGGEESAANTAQIHALRVLTEMLRSKYRIPASDCVTHAQVSVNPDNMRIGYHTDWAGNFPFEQVGLRDNYAVPPPSLYAFGFEYDPAFVNSTGARVWKGLLLAEEQVREQAAARGLTESKYRARLQQRYRQIHAALANVNPKEKQL